jgi:hypothetical protein
MYGSMKAGIPRPPGRSRLRLRRRAIPKLPRTQPPTLAARVTPAPTATESPRPPAKLPPSSQPEQTTTSEPPPPTAPIAETTQALTLRGEYWEALFEGRRVMLDDSRGLRYIALLIRDAGPGHGPLHAKELVALASGREPEAMELERDDDVLDPVAQKQLIERLAEIASERDAACAAGNLTKAARLDDEHERIATELSHAAAPAARRRSAAFSHAGEKARKAVAKAISEALARIASCPDGPSLARHLTATIRKGQWLSYTGNLPWNIDFHAPLPRK